VAAAQVPWQLADLPFAPPGRIERDLTPGFSVNIGARVNRVERNGFAVGGGGIA
jgi:hypothetical protein